MRTDRLELRHHLWANRDRDPDGPALRCGTEVTTWAELHDNALAVAAGAAALPAGPVVVVVDGGAASVTTVLGLLVAGVTIALVEERSSYLGDESSVLHGFGGVAVVSPDGVGAGSMAGWRYRDLLAPHGDLGSGPDGELLQLTSGSTGEPRLARQSLHSALIGARSYRTAFGLTPKDSVLLTVPPAHSFGLIGGVLAAVVTGARLWLLPRFTARGAVDAITAGATVMLGTPLVYRLLTPVLRPKTSRLRIALSSGGPLDGNLAASAADRLGCPVRQVYGSTETGLIACHSVALADWPVGSVGMAAPGVRVRVRDGRVQVRTSTLFLGYAGESSPVSTEDGFYDTGDTGRLGAAGHLFLTGRKEGFINVGGRKVNPQRIARILGECPGVRDVYVYGHLAGDGEQQVHAAVVLTPPATAADVIAFCRSRRLMPYEVPHRLHPLPELPRSAMGKVSRRAVAEAVAARSSDSNEETA
jgi:acyl-CoA synthetase (AMP-forming)/AMP-acid ligase II